MLGYLFYVNVRILWFIFETDKEILKDVYKVISCFFNSIVEDLESFESGGMKIF